jgi:hypothetical protein
MKPQTVEQLKPGTTLTVTYTSTWPPVGAQVTTLTGTVWYAGLGLFSVSVVMRRAFSVAKKQTSGS